MTTEHHPRLGAADVSQRTSAGVRVFGVVSTDGTAEGLLLPITRVGSWSSECGSHEHLWMVGSTAKERLIWAPVPMGPSSMASVTPLRRSVMRLRITTSDSAGGTVYEVDLGQSLELYAQSLVVDLLAPEGAIELTDDDAAPRQGLLFESQCMVRLLRLEASRGACSALLTESVYVPGGEPYALRVPSGARRLTLYATSLVSPPVARWLRGDPSATAIPIGLLPWPPDHASTEACVPSATHLVLEPDPMSRVFTFVWTIAP